MDGLYQTIFALLIISTMFMVMGFWPIVMDYTGNATFKENGTIFGSSIKTVHLVIGGIGGGLFLLTLLPIIFMSASKGVDIYGISQSKKQSKKQKQPIVGVYNDLPRTNYQPISNINRFN